MGREIRMVPAGWEHPRDDKGELIPLHGWSFSGAMRDWEKDMKAGDANESDRPNQDRYMPEWPDEQRTHLMMYETCTEGTPISPAMETPEQLAKWLYDNKASAFGSMTATYEEWLRVCRGGWAPSAALIPGRGFISGVSAMSDK